MQLKQSINALKKDLDKINRLNDGGVFIVRREEDTNKISVYCSGKNPKTLTFDTLEEYEQFREKHRSKVHITRGAFIINDIPRPKSTFIIDDFDDLERPIESICE